MVSQRRGIHSKSNDEKKENKQVVHKCCKCDTPISKDKIEDGELGKEPANNLPARGKRQVYPDLNDIEESLCAECENTINQGSESKFTKKSNAGKYNVNFRLLGLKLRKSLKLCLIIILAVVAIWFIFAFFFNKKNADKSLNVRIENQTQEAIDLDNDLDDLELTYNKQEERVWYTFGGGIKSVLSENPNKPSVFLLLHDNDQAGNTAKCLAQDISKVATKYLMKQEIKPLTYAGADLNKKRIMDDPGELLVLLKDKVEKTGAMIVINLEEVQPKIAAMFHYFCDRFSPAVDKAIYIFTVRFNQTSTTSLQKDAEHTLQRLWENDLQDNVLHALITRMTGNVMKISDDYNNCNFDAQRII